MLSQIKAPKLAATVRLQPRLLAWVCRWGRPAAGPLRSGCGSTDAPAAAILRGDPASQSQITPHAAHCNMQSPALTCRKALKTATKESRSGKEGAGLARMYLGGWVGASGRMGGPPWPCRATAFRCHGSICSRAQ